MKKYTFLVLLFILSLNSAAQSSNRRTILRDNHIKKILTYFKDSIGDPGYLMEIVFLNDSGLIAKKVFLNRKQDTIEAITYRYNEENLEVYCEDVFNGKSKIWTTSYRKLSDSESESSTTCNGVTTISTSKEKRTKQKLEYWYYYDGKLTLYEFSEKRSGLKTFDEKGSTQKCWHYKNGKFVGSEITQNNLRISKFKTSKKRKSVQTSYLDPNGNVMKERRIFYDQAKQSIGGYQEIDTETGKVTKDTRKSKTFKYAEEQLTAYEYNEMGLVKRKIAYPHKTIQMTKGYIPSVSCYNERSYEYLTE